jgi:hypothetical protein
LTSVFSYGIVYASFSNGDLQMDIYIKEAVKAVLNIIDDSECQDLKVGLRNVADYSTETNKEDMRRKCINLLDCHEECITASQRKTAKKIIELA